MREMTKENLKNAFEAIFVCPVCGHTIKKEAPEKCPVCNLPKDKYEVLTVLHNISPALFQAGDALK